MIKKRIFTLLLIVAGLFLSKLYSSSDTPQSQQTHKVFTYPQKLAFLDTLQSPTKVSIPVTKKEGYWETLTFADEQIPVEQSKVKQKLKNFLAKFSYRKMQSYSMHRDAEKYLPEIAKILKSHGVPEDFKYIPMVESGFDPSIRTSAGAGGYWQFIPSTARLYGLKVNGDVDERMNLTKSTHAAARYFKNLYKEFGDWTLVAAAYNVGGGSLKKSMRRQGKRNYYNLDLNRETAAYVYKVISMKEVIENPGKYGYKRLAKKAESTASTASEPDII